MQKVHVLDSSEIVVTQPYDFFANHREATRPAGQEW